MPAPLMPAAISLPVSNRQLLTDLDLLQRHFMRQFFQKFGAQNYTDFLQMHSTKVEVKGRDFYHHESRGKLHSAVKVNAQITAPAAGADITITITAADHFNSGTQSPLRLQELVRVGTSGIEGKIVAMNKTTPNAHTATIRPLKSTQAFVSAGSANLAAGELITLMGPVDIGERSTAPDPMINLTEKILGTTTEIRECWRETDRSLIESIEFDYDGKEYLKYKGMDETQRRFNNQKEFKCMFGDTANNLAGVGGSVGTQGVIPRVKLGGQGLQYTAGSWSMSTFDSITQAILYNGGATEYDVLRELNLTQEMDAELTSQYDAGSVVYGQSNGDDQLSIAYGFKRFVKDGVTFNFKTYLPFSPEAVYGMTPTTGIPEFRGFGLFIPKNRVSDPVAGTNIPTIRMVVNKPSGQTNDILSWQTGAFAQPQPIGEVAELAVHWLGYFGIEMAAVNQYVYLYR